MKTWTTRMLKKRMKTKNLKNKIEIIEDLETGRILAYYTRGHVKRSDFADQVQTEQDLYFPIGTVQFCYMKRSQIPPSDEFFNGVLSYFVFCPVDPGVGSYPVTIVDADQGQILIKCQTCSNLVIAPESYCFDCQADKLPWF